MEFDLYYRQVGSPSHHLHTGHTRNVSPGGLYLETLEDVCKPGNLVEVTLAIPPKLGVLEFGGKLAGLARVLRVTGLGDSRTDGQLSSGEYGVALAFCGPLKLRP
jgi:hypothetical protein